MVMNVRIVYQETAVSTNDEARQLAESGAREGAVVVTNFQTRGRGRAKNRWQSKRGRDLLFSILLRPKVSASTAPMLTQVSAEVLTNILKRRFGLSAKIKRPNDVLVAGKKISGILTEASGRGSRPDYVIVGIGLNVNSRASELPKTATSLRIVTKKEISRRELLVDLLSEFETTYKAFLGQYGKTLQGAAGKC